MFHAALKKLAGTIYGNALRRAKRAERISVDSAGGFNGAAQ